MEKGIEKFKIGDEVVRSVGDYVVGRIGKVIAIDEIKLRCQVDWYCGITTWVSLKALELTSIPYCIIPEFYDEKKRKYVFPKYKRI